jgi:hypothetical protein
MGWKSEKELNNPSGNITPQFQIVGKKIMAALSPSG